MVDVAGQAKMSDLMCFGPTPKLTVWDQQKSHILLTVCAGATLKHSIDYVFAFTITNPGQDQDSPLIAIGASCSMAVIPAMPMDKPNEYVVGVANGSDPLKIVVPIFNDKTVSQSTPLPGFDNTIRLFLRSSINLAAEDESVITISGFTGATSDETSSVKVLKNGADVVGLFCVGDTAGDANYGVWDGGLGSLVFTICSGETFEAGSEYQLEWLVRNPQEAQSSPGISITALGTATFVRDSVDKPEQDILGVANGVHPLLVITPSFVTKVLAQSNFLAGEENQITATLVSNVDVGSAGSTFISICCLD